MSAKAVPCPRCRYLTGNMEQKAGSREDEGRARQENRHCSVCLCLSVSCFHFYPADPGVL